MSTDLRISKMFLLIAERCGREHGTPLPKELLAVGDCENGWGVQLNPTDGKMDCIEPYHAFVSWNGFPAGIIGPSGGVLAGGDCANEDSFREWLEAK